MVGRYRNLHFASAEEVEHCSQLPHGPPKVFLVKCLPDRMLLLQAGVEGPAKGGISNSWLMASDKAHVEFRNLHFGHFFFC